MLSQHVHDKLQSSYSDNNKQQYNAAAFSQELDDNLVLLQMQYDISLYGIKYLVVQLVVVFIQMLDNHDDDNNNVEESVIAKSTGEQEEEDVAV